MNENMNVLIVLEYHSLLDIKHGCDIHWMTNENEVE
jgi:hypothetical protein